MSDSFTQVTKNSFGSRIKGALIGMIIWPILIVGASIFLWTNEWRNANMVSGLKEGRSSVQEADASMIDATLEAKFVHTTGNAVTDSILTDSEFDISVPAIKVERKAEMYQWTEDSESRTTDNYGWSSTTTTTYTYKKEWASTPIRSSSFAEVAGHENPTEWKYHSLPLIASDVTLGVYSLSSSLIEQISAENSLNLSEYSPKLHTGEYIQNNVIYVGSDMSQPNVWDMRLTYTVANTGMPISVLGKQSWGTIVSYIAKSWSDITRVESGTKSAEEMIEAAESENTFITWVYRGLGILFIFTGFTLFFSILPILTKIIPPLSWIAEAWVSLVSLMLTALLGGGIIIIAWFLYRPFLSLGILVLVGLIVWGVYRLIQKKKDAPSSPTQSI